LLTQKLQTLQASDVNVKSIESVDTLPTSEP
jgi:hypothetical protein